MASSVHGTLSPNAAPVLRREILANSITVSIYDYVIATSGFLALGTTGTLLAGTVMGIGTDKGVGLNTTGVAGAEMGSYVNTFLTASDNQTVAKVRADLDISKNTLMSITPDAAIGTTTGSNLLGYHVDIVDEDNTSESSTITGTAQLTIWGVDPQVAANHVVSIYESVFIGV